MTWADRIRAYARQLQPGEAGDMLDGVADLLERLHVSLVVGFVEYRKSCGCIVPYRDGKPIAWHERPAPWRRESRRGFGW